MPTGWLMKQHLPHRIVTEIINRDFSLRPPNTQVSLPAGLSWEFLPGMPDLEFICASKGVERGWAKDRIPQVGSKTKSFLVPQGSPVILDTKQEGSLGGSLGGAK